MTDVDVYDNHDDHDNHKNYIRFQMLRPDYIKAISKSISLSVKYTKNRKTVDIADFCCGIGSNTQKLSKKRALNKALLIDINKGFLDIAKKSAIVAKELEIKHGNILLENFDKSYDIVFSIFAYHHMKDNEKLRYIEQIKKALKPKGVLILTEIFLNNKKEGVQYYKKLLESVQANKRVSGLKEFLEQTAKSTEFEFKVPKKIADSQFQSSGFRLLEQVKVWPKDDSVENGQGTFVQVYILD
jgi:SAM-dependent methyltransferase